MYDLELRHEVSEYTVKSTISDDINNGEFCNYIRTHKIADYSCMKEIVSEEIEQLLKAGFSHQCVRNELSFCRDIDTQYGGLSEVILITIKKTFTMHIPYTNFK